MTTTKGAMQVARYSAAHTSIPSSHRTKRTPMTRSGSNARSGGRPQPMVRSPTPAPDSHTQQRSRPSTRAMVVPRRDMCHGSSSVGMIRSD